MVNRFLVAKIGQKMNTHPTLPHDSGAVSEPRKLIFGRRTERFLPINAGEKNTQISQDLAELCVFDVLSSEFSSSTMTCHGCAITCRYVMTCHDILLTHDMLWHISVCAKGGLHTLRFVHVVFSYFSTN